MKDWLEQRSDDELAALLTHGRALGPGAGGGPVLLDVEGVQVFAKRVPLTRRELDRPYSTENLFDLPVVCQYGIGSPGFNAWRELAANQLVAGTPGFPLLLHHRVLPGRAAITAEFLDIDAASARLGGSPQIRARFTELAAAEHSLVLFFEHVPLALREWLTPDLLPEVERQLMEIVAALRSLDLLHLDVHFGNIRSDGERVYLADFGLATSPRFDLDAAEHEFARRHAGHDAELVALHLVNHITKAIPDPSPAVAEMLERLGPTAAKWNDFYRRLMGQPVQ
ncbi:serine/threonine protein phosphatase [Lentzea sp. PSKA42]|uniref:Serine/threonine protein phosphatase n=1 Tax=Lentzea indica TaxID=2604800 RepID=A0ABX1FI67_9PSEU|nr:serine/threonine protein phosphatase [Lentzea indica]NKE58653.1 serine/threonine protein phosphatase [Lentzea indica]